MEDAQDCFNVNNLLAAEKIPQAKRARRAGKPRNEQIVEQILTESGISHTTAEEVYQQLVDYLDGDATTAKDGAESDAGRASCPPDSPRTR